MGTIHCLITVNLFEHEVVWLVLAAIIKCQRLSILSNTDLFLAGLRSKV